MANMANPTTIQPEDYRVKENWLFFRDKTIAPVQVPFGLGVGREFTIEEEKVVYRRQEIRVVVKDSAVVALDVKSRTDGWRPVLPAFVMDITLKGMPVRIETAITDWHRSAARMTVAKTHYLSPRPGGFILIARALDQTRAKQKRTEWWTALPRGARALYGSDPATAGSAGDVIGALHLERLYHGHPGGRAAIYEAMRKKMPTTPKAGTRAGFRRRVVKELGVYWISRVAVDAPFWNLGIGAVLCDAAREIAADRMLEKGRHVELIRRMRITDFHAVASGDKSDFLTGEHKLLGADLQYGLHVPDVLSRVAPQEWNAELGRWEFLPHPEKRDANWGDCLAYYYAEAGPMVIGRARRRPSGKRKS